MKIAIVILNWNGQELLAQFLPSIIKYSKLKNCTIYVADNASTDTSVKFIKEKYKSVKIIQNKENGGYAKGYNDALKQIDADIFALVNSDIEVTKGWLQPIISAFESQKNTAIIQPKILNYKRKNSFEYAGAAGGFLDKYGFPFCRGRIFNYLETDKQQYDTDVDIFWASGACFFIRSEVFNELLFDEDYFAHQEEIDLCWRVKNKGSKIKYIHNSTVYHVGGATLDETNPRKTYLNFRNSLFNLTKHVPLRFLFQVLFIRLAQDGIATINFLFQKKPKHGLAVLKSHVSFYFNLIKNLKKRRKSKQKKKNYYYIRSIVWQHFINGKKVFTKL
jgi:GT2 family glycosyltransferase